VDTGRITETTSRSENGDKTCAVNSC
jgi:hypothetical protein